MATKTAKKKKTKTKNKNKNSLSARNKSEIVVVPKSKQNNYITPSKRNVNYTDDVSVLDLQKNHDVAGTSIVRVNDPYFIRHPELSRSSKYGAVPLEGYGNTSHHKSYDTAYVVKKHNAKKYAFAYNYAIEKSNHLSREAVELYEHELERVKLLKQKNLTIAKINSLRLINKAIILEKAFQEAKFENQRHKSVVNDIKRLKPILLEQNDVELKETLARLSFEKEVELASNIADKNRALSKIEEKRELIMLKRKWKADRIKALSQGKEFNERLNPKDIREIREKYRSYNNDEKIFVEDTNDIAKIIGSMDTSRLSLEEKIIIEKFLKLNSKDSDLMKKMSDIKKYHNENENQKEKVREYRERLNNNIKNRRYTIVSASDYDKVIDAKKEIFMISEDATKFANSYRSLHSVYEDFDYKDDRTSRFEDVYTKKEITHSIDKWKRIERAIKNNDDYRIIQLPDNSYRIEYLKNVSPTSKKQKIRKEQNYHSFRTTWRNVSDAISNKTQFYSPRKINKMREDFTKMCHTQIVQDNIDVFLENNLNLREIMHKFNLIDPNEFERTPENENFVKNMIGQAFSIYYRLVDAEIEKRRLVEKSQQLDEIFERDVKEEDERLLELTINADQRFKNRNSEIEKKYQDRVEHVKNKHFIAREEILENYEVMLSKEEQAHLSNIAFYKNHIRRLQESQLKFEIAEIDNILNKIEKFNQRNKDIRIPLADLPVKINPKASLSENIKIDLTKNNVNKVTASTMLDDETLLVSNVINKELPRDVDKIVVLDKFRNVKDPVTRAAMLRELANVNYDKDLQNIDKLEASGIVNAKKKLESRLNTVEKIREEAELIKKYNIHMSAESKKINDFQNDVKRLNKEKNKQLETDLKIREKMLRDELKLLELEQKKEESYASHQVEEPKKKLKLMVHNSNVSTDHLGKVHKAKKPSKITTSKTKALLLDEREKKKRDGTPKVKSTNVTKVDAKKREDVSKKKTKRRFNILSFNRGYEDIDLDEIIGKKSKK